MAGVFITFEGCDGVGKSTQLSMLADRLTGEGIDFIRTREPGGSPGAEEIRELLVKGGTDRWSADTELLLFNAARRDHMEKTLIPALEQGKVVLCDRYVDSTRAYQSIGRGISRAMVDGLHDLMIDLNPDATVLLDGDPEKMLARAEKRNDTDTRFEGFGLKFQQDLRAAFLEISEEEPIRCLLVDADRDQETVHNDIWAQLMRRVPQISGE